MKTTVADRTEDTYKTFTEMFESYMDPKQIEGYYDEKTQTWVFPELNEKFVEQGINALDIYMSTYTKW